MTMREQLTERFDKGHLSYSSIKHALGDMKVWEMYMKGELYKESEALRFGTLYDMLLFEREKAMNHYRVLNDEDLARGINSSRPKLTTKYKERLAAATAEALEAGQEVVTGEDWKKAAAMIDRLGICGLRSELLSGQFQVEFNEDIDGIPVKGFLDCLNEDNIVDSKSSRGIDKFKYDVRSFSYDIQAYIYTKVFDIKDFYWVVQEKTYPYLPAKVKCSDETLFSGEMKFHQGVENIKNWLDGNSSTETYYADFIV